MKGADQDRLLVAKTYKLYLGGAFPRTESGRTIKVLDTKGNLLANTCRASRKDCREAVVAARGAAEGWAARSGYNRGQILYRAAEMLEGRSEQFIEELRSSGSTEAKARKEVASSVDRLVHYAGWTDKYHQIFGGVNPVASSHFNFSLPEASGVTVIIASNENPLLGLVSMIAPAIAGGNTVVCIASETFPLSAITFGEVLNASDLPGGVVNLLTGQREELIPPLSGHMDVNALVYADLDEKERKPLEEDAARNLKRIVRIKSANWFSDEAEGPYPILDLQEIKTTWHPIGQ
ncbi:MAG: aldehyde dehydrogenase [Opitutae bacterium]|nr:aldehyde dehydrogenase [Opitutae bacterium]|tara:strand:+ start:3247 stop:4122 length:876 start_codon:yes stop_codon:yes gene_type:complete